MKDEIPFNAWSKEKIAQGKKFCTSRHKKYLHDKRVLHITDKIPWVFIREHLYKCEGADTPMELQMVIERIMKRCVPDDEMFFVHFGDFREKKEAEKMCKDCTYNVFDCDGNDDDYPSCFAGGIK